MSEKLKAVIYARYSSDNQREESIEGQLRDCKEYAKYNDILLWAVILIERCPLKRITAPTFKK